ncbi:MAG: hypothetical protein ABIS67_00475 [Candidatus Eisenbacteria bacterium]
MDPALHLLPTPAGLALAAVAVAMGAPLFSDGLRALRLRRHLSLLRQAPLTTSTDGFTHSRGVVALDSPLFSPLSGLPCAGFRLEIAAEGRPVRRHLDVRRSFRLLDGDVSARVPATIGRWVCAATASRRIAPRESLNENMMALLGRIPEVVWLRRAGVAFTLTERALIAGKECHVVGTARSAASLAYVGAFELERTGTDDSVIAMSADNEVDAFSPRAADFTGAAPGTPSVAYSNGEHLDFLLVTDQAPPPELMNVSMLRVLGVALGPALSLAGIIYLAAVADALRATGRM